MILKGWFMKRNNKTPDKIRNNIKRVKRTFPLFSWKTCIKCTNEFRWEWGYKFKLSYMLNSKTLHVCPECGHGKKNACDLFLSRQEYLDRRRRNQYTKNRRERGDRYFG